MERIVSKIKSVVKNFDIFELGNSAMLYYFLMFGALPLAVFLRLPTHQNVQRILGNNISLINAETFFYLLLGLIFFVLGYRFSLLKRWFEKMPNILKKEWDFKKVPVVFGILFVVGVAVKVIRFLAGGYFHLNVNPLFASGPFYTLLAELSWVGSIALAIAFISYFHLLKAQDRRYRVWQIIAWSAFILEFSYGFLSGRRAGAIIPIIIYLLVKYYLSRISYRRVFLALLIVLIIILPLGNFVRVPNQTINYFRFVGESVSEVDFSRIPQLIIDNSLGRISQNRIVLLVFEKTQEFLYGKTLLSFFVSLGPPRFVWKNKPLSINAYGNEFGRNYEILTPGDFKTSVAPTIVGDWYMNFGLVGIIGGMFLIGALFRLIFQFLIDRTNPVLSGVMIYSVFWPSIIRNMESWIAPAYAGLVRLFILLLIIHFFLIAKSRKN